jgi:hypothetical protein
LLRQIIHSRVFGCTVHPRARTCVFESEHAPNLSTVLSSAGHGPDPLFWVGKRPPRPHGAWQNWVPVVGRHL